MKKKILKTKLKYNQDPQIVISQLEDLVIQYNDAGGNWTEMETLEHICGSLTKPYEIVIHHLEKRIGDSTDPLTVGSSHSTLLPLKVMIFPIFSSSVIDTF